MPCLRPSAPLTIFACATTFFVAGSAAAQTPVAGPAAAIPMLVNEPLITAS